MKSTLNTRGVNTFEYGWVNIKILINNTLTFSATSISYSETVESENLYGLGNLPVSRSVGNVSFEASVTIRKSDVIALQKAAYAQGIADGSITGFLPFPVIVSYERADGSGFTTDTLLDAQFTSNSISSSQGDKDINVELPLIIGGIKWGQ